MKKLSNSKSVQGLNTNLWMYSIIVAVFWTMTGCGNAAKKEKCYMDSILKDSIMMDSVRKVTAAAHWANSLAATTTKMAAPGQLPDSHTATPANRKFIKTAELKFKVSNVLYATESMEDLTAKYGGYMIYSNLVNRLENSERSKVSRDSILISKEIVVENQLQLRIPTQNLDSFVRSLKPIVVFLDYRIIKLNDITLQFISNQKRTDRLQTHEKRQAQHIDSKPAKLNETTNAEDHLLERQNQADEVKLKSMMMEDQVNYCTVTIEIYQKPFIKKETIANFEYISDVKPNFFARMWDSIAQGWDILEEVVVFLLKVWGIAVLIIGIVFGIRFLGRLYKRLSNN